MSISKFLLERNVCLGLFRNKGSWYLQKKILFFRAAWIAVYIVNGKEEKPIWNDDILSVNNCLG